MLRTFRRSSSAQTLRRLLAVLLAVCVGVAFAEAMIADECDDVVTQVATDTRGDDAGMVSVTAAESSETPQNDGPASDQHTVHLCHCAHTHVGTLAAGHTIPEDVETVSEIAVRHAAQIPPTVSGEPQLRPPRVLTA